MLDAFPADTIGTIYELGAGWGALAFPLALKFPKCEVIAYELSPLPWLYMLIRARLCIRPNLTIRRGNIQLLPLDDAVAVCMYLYSQGVEKLKPRLEAELAPGTLVISNTFEVPGWHPKEVHQLDDTMCPQILVYQTL